MRCVVTGGSGFVGSHLCERLLANGADVLCIDNLITGVAENISTLRQNGRFTFQRADITQPFVVEGPVDAIYHLASPASPRGYLRKPLETALVNSIGTNRVLELAAATGARFLLAST